MSEPPSEDFADLYETAPCGYLSLSAAGIIVKVNATLCEWLGYRPDEIVGQPIHVILGFGGRIAFETHLAPLLRMQGHVHEIALDLLNADGEKMPAIGNASEKRSADGHHLFTRLTLFRAVDRRSYERNLVGARQKAEAESKADREAISLRDQFIAVLGHDLRNPLAATAAGISLIAKREQLSERGKLILRDMGGSVERASRLVNDLLDLARGSLGGGFLVNRKLDELLAPMLEQVVNEARNIAPDHRIEADIQIFEPVCCDRERIGQLASNLLANAVTHGAADHPILLRAVTSDSTFTLSVSNSGEQIPDEILSHLFQPFFRGAARPSSKRSGSRPVHRVRNCERS